MPPAVPYTIGIEEEYQLVDAVTGALRSYATRIRDADWTGELLPEMQETTVEVGTPICSSAAEAADHLERLRLQASTVASAHGLAIVAAGIHPFSGWHGHERPPLERYRTMEARYGRIARDEHIFGMHVHVTVPDTGDRLAISNVVRHYLPHLLALSASSPFFEGEDTEYSSYRTLLWRRWPNAGIPPRFDDEADFRAYMDLLLDADVLADPWSVYWSVRPHPTYATIEVRVMDVCPNVRDAAAIAALARALVHAIVHGDVTDAERHGRGRALEQELLRTNEWSSARHGLDARWLDTLSGSGHMPMRRAILQLLDRLAPSAAVLGDDAAFAHVATIVHDGNAADRMRTVYNERGSMKELVHWLMAESLIGTGLDRRAKQRDHA